MNSGKGEGPPSAGQSDQSKVSPPSARAAGSGCSRTVLTETDRRGTSLQRAGYRVPVAANGHPLPRMQTVTSWRELDEAIADPKFGRHEHHARSTLVFRGLARSTYTNTSSLARLSGDYPSLERHLMRNFRKYAHKNTPGPTEWDWMALGQHHGLPTRLLDWTFSPFVALHFATASWPEDDAVLWAVDVAEVHRHLPEVLRRELQTEGSLVFTTGQLTEHATNVWELDGLRADEPFALFF